MKNVIIERNTWNRICQYKISNSRVIVNLKRKLKIQLFLLMKKTAGKSWKMI